MATWFEEYFACWDALDIEGVLGWVTDDGYYEDVALGHSAKGKKAIRRFVEASFENVPDASFEFVEGFDDGEHYAMRWIMQPMGVPGVSYGTLRDGKISENRDYWNGALFAVPNT
jgi:ketosteroid isomerase-like protein